MCKNLPSSCWNQEIWSNINTFEIILGKHLGDAKKIMLGKMSPWHCHCKNHVWPSFIGSFRLTTASVWVMLWIQNIVVKIDCIHQTTCSMVAFVYFPRWVHSPLTTCTHDRSKNRGKGVVFITCPQKFNVREIKKKGCFGAQCPHNKKIGYFFQNPQRFTPLKIQYFLADFSRFPSVFHQIWLVTL